MGQAKAKQDTTQALDPIKGERADELETLIEQIQEQMTAHHDDEGVCGMLGRLYDQAAALRYTREQINQHIQQVRRNTAELERGITERGRVSNSLGALQSSGLELDRLCGVHAAQHDALARMVAMANAALAAA